MPELNLAAIFAELQTYLLKPETIVAAVIGAVTIVASGFSAVSAHFSQKRASQQADEAAAIQHKMQEDSLRISGETLRASVDAQIFTWGEQVILLLADAHALAARRGRYGTPQDFAMARDTLAARISGYIDQGRLFFLNDSSDLVGLDRPAAMRGYRPPVLDAALLVYQELTLLDAGEATQAKVEAAAIFEMRRAFISELQKALDPRRRRAVLDRLVSNRKEEEAEVAALTAEANAVDTVNWDGVTPVVDEFEKRHGQGSFWKDRPRPRSQVVREMREKR